MLSHKQLLVESSNNLIQIKIGKRPKLVKKKKLFYKPTNQCKTTTTKNQLQRNFHEQTSSFFFDENSELIFPFGVLPMPPLFGLVELFSFRFSRKEFKSAEVVAPSDNRAPFLLGVGGPGFW